MYEIWCNNKNCFWNKETDRGNTMINSCNYEDSIIELEIIGSESLLSCINFKDKEPSHDK